MSSSWNEEAIAALDWDKGQGLVPAIVQHATEKTVLMLGYMNREALQRTVADSRVTFFSRSKNRLWLKGETSGNTLTVVRIAADCDLDTLLIEALPQGPTCHTGAASCFSQEPTSTTASFPFLGELERIIAEREAMPREQSYVHRMLQGDTRQIAQKVGEEGMEVALAAIAQNDAELAGEAADLAFHLLVLLRKRGLALQDVVALLAARHAEARSNSP